MKCLPEISLNLGFKRTDGGSSRLTIGNARDNVTEAEVNALMDQIIAADIFQPNGLSLVTKSSIELVTTDTTEFEVL